MDAAALPVQMLHHTLSPVYRICMPNLHKYGEGQQLLALNLQHKAFIRPNACKGAQQELPLK